MKYKKRLIIPTVLLSFIAIYFAIAKQEERKNYAYLKTELIKGKEDDQAWLSILPQIDSSLQNEFKSCLKKLQEKQRDVNATLRQTKGVRYLDEKEKCYLVNKSVPIQLLDCHEALREPMNELLKLFTKGKICFSNAPWAYGDFQSNWFDINRKSYSCLINAVRWLTDEILLTNDPSLALEQLDQFLDSFQPFSSATDAMIWGKLSSWRDRSYLLLFIKNRLSKEKINIWLDEKPAFFQAVHQGITFDRKLNWEPFVQDLLEGSIMAQEYLYNMQPDPLDFEHHSYKGLVAILQALCCSERAFDRIYNPLEIIEVKKILSEGGLFSERHSICVVSNKDVLEVMALEASHRMARLLVKTVQLAGEIPEDEEELRNLLGLHAKCLDASHSQLPIRYEKVHNDRIRFYIPEDLGPFNALKDHEQSGKQRPTGSDSSSLPRQDWAYELQVKFS